MKDEISNLKGRRPVSFLNLNKQVWHNVPDLLYADVMELVDMRDLGSRVARRVGSTPIIGTTLLNLFSRRYCT